MNIQCIVMFRINTPHYI